MLQNYCYIDIEFIEACIDNDISTIKSILEQWRFNLMDEKVNKALYYVSMKGYTEVVKLLLKHPLFYGDLQNAINVAAKKGHLEVVKLLLSEYRIDPSSYGPIISAAEYGHIEIVELLLKDPRIDPSDDDNRALYLACAGGYHKIVKLLLNNIESNDIDDYTLTDCISAASTYGYLEVIKILLIDTCANPSYGIIDALSNGHHKVAELLLSECYKRNIKIPIKDLAINEIVTKGNLEIVKIILNLKDLNNKQLIHPKSILCSSFIHNHIRKYVRGYMLVNAFKKINKIICMNTIKMFLLKFIVFHPKSIYVKRLVNKFE
jgi:ankyrin repeat protein